MSDIAKYQFDLVRDDKGGVMISMPEKDRKAFGLEMQPPLVYLGDEPTPEGSIEILKAAINGWYYVCTGITADRILTEMTEFHDDGYPKTMKLSVN